MSRVLVLSFTDLASDPRVDRQIAALRGYHQIVAAGLAPPRQWVDEFVQLPHPRLTLRGKVGAAARVLARRYDAAYWTHPTYVAALDLLREVRLDVAVANDLNALPIALSLHVPVVFDAHEYAPEQQADELWWRLLLRPYVRWLCKRYIPEVASMTTVGEAIADAYESDTGVRAAVVNNAPPRIDLAPSPVHDPVRILHHGVAAPGRGLEEMIRLGDLLDNRFTLDFMLTEGSRGYRDELIRRANGNPRVRFPDPVPMDRLVRNANNYDIGLYSLAPSNFNRRFALPNKFFEFVQARLAVVIGPSPEMARFVEQYGLGVVANDFAAETIASALNDLDDASITAFKRASDIAARELCSEQNAAAVIGAVDAALAR